MTGDPPGAAAGGRRAPVPPWREWPVGSRVVVRRTLPEGGLGDVLGLLVASDASGVRVLTRRGEVAVAAAEIVLGKVVPPAPARRAPRGD